MGGDGNQGPTPSRPHALTASETEQNGHYQVQEETESFLFCVFYVLAASAPIRDIGTHFTGWPNGAEMCSPSEASARPPGALGRSWSISHLLWSGARDHLILLFFPLSGRRRESWMRGCQGKVRKSAQRTSEVAPAVGRGICHLSCLIRLLRILGTVAGSHQFIGGETHAQMHLRPCLWTLVQVRGGAGVS